MVGVSKDEFNVLLEKHSPEISKCEENLGNISNDVLDNFFFVTMKTNVIWSWKLVLYRVTHKRWDFTEDLKMKYINLQVEFGLLPLIDLINERHKQGRLPLGQLSKKKA